MLNLFYNREVEGGGLIWPKTPQLHNSVYRYNLRCHLSGSTGFKTNGIKGRGEVWRKTVQYTSVSLHILGRGLYGWTANSSLSGICLRNGDNSENLGMCGTQTGLSLGSVRQCSNVCNQPVLTIQLKRNRKSLRLIFFISFLYRKAKQKQNANQQQQYHHY